MVQFKSGALILTLLITLVAVDASAIERRQKQFKTDTAYLALPAPYSVPGVGAGIAYSLIAANVAGSYMDLLAMKATGAAEGTFLQISDLHLISETLILAVSNMAVSSFPTNHYKTRGINSDKMDYITLVNALDEQFYNITLTAWERRISLYSEHTNLTVKNKQGLDPEGNLLFDFANPTAIKTQRSSSGLKIDYTDDYLDPRLGVRLDVRSSNSPPITATESDYNVVDKVLNIYIPIGSDSVWAFHAMRSDAEVIQVGETDHAKLAAELGLTCSYADCSADAKALIDHRQLEREKGTASAIGGFNHLRSYPLDRFQGAHTQVFSTELRLSMSDNATPFDFWIWKDISTSIQWAFFYDVGTVAESTQDLWKLSTSSAGTGLRMVAASGYVYRADVATGDEGPNVSVVFEYPW